MKKRSIRILTCLVLLIAMVAALSGSSPKSKGTVRKDLTAIQVTKLMGNGINLGNTMEAYGHKQLGTTAAVKSYETLWGMPVTTQKMVTGMKKAGFDSLRIPVAWTNMMNYESGDYTINKAYLDRVETIVNYAFKEKMYVIINDHWDGSWWGMFGSATPETRDKAMKLYTSMWTQIADRFKNYSDYLIFEGANEELGDRLNDKDVAADSGTLSKDECYQMANKINQTFVDTIRATGGNNALRFLLIPGYGTDFEKTCDDRFVMPKDTAKNKLLLSVHYYNPWGYCGNSSISKWGTEKEYNDQNKLMASLTKFTKKGYGVVIGEYAVAFKADGKIKPNTSDFISNLLNNNDRYGYCPMLWDCNGLYNRKSGTIKDKTVAKIFKSRNVAAQSKLSDKKIVSNAKKALDTALKKAKKNKADTPSLAGDGKAVAWLMFNSGDWALQYCVGNTYDPNTKTDGLVAKDVAINGEGTYTVGLDFSGAGNGSANSTVFCALGIANGEILYPGYSITILDFKVNGESYKLTGTPYTTSDDQVCTRVNFYNSWVTELPEDAHTVDGNLSGASAMVIDPKTIGDKIKTIEVTFKYSLH